MYMWCSILLTQRNTHNLHKDKHTTTQMSNITHSLDTFPSLCSQIIAMVHAFRVTFECAVKNKCIPCFYKLFPSGRLETKEGETLCLPCNVRPEICPRSQGERSLKKLFARKSRVLTVGDGDLSYSRSLLSMGLTKHLVATTHETFESVVTTYPNSSSIINELLKEDVKVFHEVDATRLEHYAPIASQQFDVVVWNFPCVRVDRGADGQVSELEQNRQLLRSFFSSVKTILREGGEVHVAHKTIEPFSWWGITELASAEGLELYQTIVFDRCCYPGYTNRKVLDKKSFPCHDARVMILTIHFNITNTLLFRSVKCRFSFSLLHLLSCKVMKVNGQRKLN